MAITVEDMNGFHVKPEHAFHAVVATDAPLIPTQLKRVVRRATLGLGRDGSFASDGSGDIFIRLAK